VVDKTGGTPQEERIRRREKCVEGKGEGRYAGSDVKEVPQRQMTTRSMCVKRA